MHWHNVNMEDNNEERTESASRTSRAENPESMESEHDEEEERSREEHERRRVERVRHRGESQNRGIQTNHRSDETMAATFEFFRRYFDKKFNSLKRELSEDNEAKTLSAAKRFKKDSDIEFKYKGNKKQYMFSLDVIDKVKVATEHFDRKQDDRGFKTLDKIVNDLNTRNKLIRMTEKVCSRLECCRRILNG